MTGEHWVADRAQILEALIAHIRSEFEKYGCVTVTCEAGKTRSDRQRSALEVYCRLVAEALNESGISYEGLFKQGYRVPWNQQTVKENIWRPVQIAVLGVESTTKPKTHQYPKVFDHINGKLAEHGIHVEWPVKRNKADEEAQGA